LFAGVSVEVKILKAFFAAKDAKNAFTQRFATGSKQKRF